MQDLAALVKGVARRWFRGPLQEDVAQQIACDILDKGAEPRLLYARGRGNEFMRKELNGGGNFKPGGSRVKFSRAERVPLSAASPHETYDLDQAIDSRRALQLMTDEEVEFMLDYFTRRNKLPRSPGRRENQIVAKIRTLIWYNSHS